MQGLLNFFVQRSFLVNLVCLFIIVLGSASLFLMNRDLHPPFQFNMIRIQAQILGASAEEMEKYVTFPIEEALEGLPGVKRSVSTSLNGSMSITLYFDAGYEEINIAIEKVRSRINSLRSRLPENIWSLDVEQQRDDDTFLAVVAIVGFDDDKPEHRKFAKKFEEQLLDISGVTRVFSDLRKEDIYVDFDLKKLQRFEVSIAEARTAIRQSTGLNPVGALDRSEERISVSIDRNISSIKDIQNLPIRTNRYGQTIRLAQVAQVGYDLEKKHDKFFLNGVAGITLVVRKGFEFDTFEVRDRMNKLIEKVKSDAPKDLTINLLVDGTSFVEKQINVLKSNGLIGIVLVILILMVFLNFRTAIMTAFGLPIAYLGTLIILHQLGIAIDLISLVGMILVVGILVDDAIIVSEKYVDLLEQGVERKKAAVEAVRDLIVPISGSILTTIVAFSPLLFIKSEISTVFYAIPVIVITSLLFSWFESFFILPNHLAHFVKPSSHHKANSFFDKMKRGYRSFLKISLRFRYLIASLLIVAFAGSLWLGKTHIKQNFNLNVGSERLTVFAVLNDSPSLQATKLAIQPIENYLKSMLNNDIENVTTSVGSVWMNNKLHRGFRYARISAYINRSEGHPSQIKTRLQNEVSSYLQSIDQTPYEKLFVEFEKEDTEKTQYPIISVRVLGHEDVNFWQMQDEISTLVSKVDGVTEFIPNPDLYQNQWVFEPNMEQLNQYQVTSGNLGQQVRSLFVPDQLIETRLRGENLYIKTRVTRQDSLGFDDITRLTVLNGIGIPIPLHYLGQWQKRKALNEIVHHNGRRNLQLDFRFDSTKLTKAVMAERINQALEPVRTARPDFSIEAMAQTDEEKETQTWAIAVAVVCILSVLFILALSLESMIQPLLVALPIPFGIMGIILALFVHDKALDMMVMIGLIGTIGVSVNASLVMVDQINKRIRGTKTYSRDDLIDGACSRLRPILLTTLTTLGGVFPMAYALGGESGFTQPLAFSLGWGISFATLLTLFALPSFLQIHYDIKALGVKLYHSLRSLKNIKTPKKEALSLSHQQLLNADDSEDIIKSKWSTFMQDLEELDPVTIEPEQINRKQEKQPWESSHYEANPKFPDSFL